MPGGKQERVAKLTLVCADDRVEVSLELATGLADYLWSGALPGSVLGAAKLSEALTRSERTRARAVEFEHYEWQAVRRGLEALDVVR